MNRRINLARILDRGLLAVVRVPDGAHLVETARALADGGVDIIEITLSVPNALEVIKDIRSAIGERVLLGAGTVLDVESAQAAIMAGAEFLVSPTVNVDVIQLCGRLDTVIVPGAFTPTEIWEASKAGAEIIKVFPASAVGPVFFSAMRGPFPQLRLMPTGNIDLNQAAEYLRAGACCLGVGNSLVDPRAVAERDFNRIRNLARQYVDVVRRVRVES